MSHISVLNASSLHLYLPFPVHIVCYNRMCEVKIDTKDVPTPSKFDFSIYMLAYMHVTEFRVASKELNFVVNIILIKQLINTCTLFTKLLNFDYKVSLIR